LLEHLSNFAQTLTLIGCQIFKDRAFRIRRSFICAAFQSAEKRDYEGFLNPCQLSLFSASRLEAAFYLLLATPFGLLPEALLTEAELYLSFDGMGAFFVRRGNADAVVAPHLVFTHLCSAYRHA
jgi:hypothetical protein